ncbi:MAG: sugar phosphate nucleotidyltransferase [Burkholderiales bacterium]
MKVVLFCGGLGLRLREFSEALPKPMVPIGHRPIVWHLMKYYAHYGYKDFVLCLGHKADVVKSYFRNYDETVSNDFVLREGGRKVELLNTDIQDWSITFVDTGMHANIGQRLRAVRRYLKDEPWFLANYSDNLSDVPLPSLTSFFTQHDKIASFLLVRPPQSFHVVKTDGTNRVVGIDPVTASDMWINGGFFCLKQEIFDYLDEGDELVVEAFQKLMPQGELIAYRHPGFWACMDTFKERQMLDDLCTRGEAPWEVWRHHKA